MIPRPARDFLIDCPKTKGRPVASSATFSGLTRPEAKRFRDMLKNVNAIPQSCKDTRPASDSADFKSWQKKVADLTLNDLVSSSNKRAPTQVLTKKLRPPITNMRFSPDGALLIAQDESAIDVVQREPFEHLFRIPALGAGQAILNKEFRQSPFPHGWRPP